jgi:hypothetical protein
MIRLTSAIMVAASCAASVAVFIPGFAPQAAARTKAGADRPAACTQAWPYYAPPCLHDDRPAGARPRVVRIIAIERIAPDRSAFH